MESVIDKLQEVIQGLEKNVLKSTVSRQWTRLLFENNWVLLTRQGYCFEKNYLLFLRGIYLIKTNQIELGKKECSKAMKICKEYNDSDTINKLKQRFKLDLTI